MPERAKTCTCGDIVDFVVWFEIAPFPMKTPVAERHTYHNFTMQFTSTSFFSLYGSRHFPEDYSKMMKIAQERSKHIERKDKVRRPGLEPGFRRWQRLVITTTLSAQMCSEM